MNYWYYGLTRHVLGFLIRSNMQQDFLVQSGALWNALAQGGYLEHLKIPIWDTRRLFCHGLLYIFPLVS